MPILSYVAQEFHFSAQIALGLPQSRFKSIAGRPIANDASCPTARVGAYGRASNTTAPVWSCTMVLVDLVRHVWKQLQCTALA